MNKVFCERQYQNIKQSECYLRKDPSECLDNERMAWCRKCPEGIKLLSLVRSPVEAYPQRPKSLYRRKSFKRQDPLEITITSDPKGIAWIYSHLQQLDVSFWKNPKFMQWQLLRLNPIYRNEIDTLSEIYLGYLNDTETFEWVESTFQKLGENYFPDPGESFDHWERRHRSWIFSIEQDFLHLRERFGSVKLLLVKEPLNLMTVKNASGEQLLISPLTIHSAGFLPIDYTVRFPLPYFLDRLPGFTVRKEKWEQTLLAFELMQNNWEEASIIKLLPFLQKQKRPYVRIGKIQKDILEDVSSAWQKLTT